MNETTILFVTTDAAYGTRLGVHLQRQGAGAHLAPDPADAIRDLVSHRPEVVVLDALYRPLDPLLIARRARGCAGFAAPAILLLAPGGVAADPWLASLADAVLDRDADPSALAREITALVLVA